jgi:hypothetical protein
MTKCVHCGDEIFTSEVDKYHICSKGKYAPKFDYDKLAKETVKEIDMSKFNRFDFEQALMGVWSICEALDDITEGALEYGWTADQVSNVSIGLKEQYQLRFEKLFDMFENGIRERKIL